MGYISDLQLLFQELDWESIAAGLLHDTVEDTKVVTFESIEKEFGSTVRHIVEGETKVAPCNMNLSLFTCLLDRVFLNMSLYGRRKNSNVKFIQPSSVLSWPR